MRTKENPVNLMFYCLVNMKEMKLFKFLFQIFVVTMWGISGLISFSCSASQIRKASSKVILICFFALRLYTRSSGIFHVLPPQSIYCEKVLVAAYLTRDDLSFIGKLA